jgi:hypothetical protein
MKCGQDYCMREEVKEAWEAVSRASDLLYLRFRDAFAKVVSQSS